MFLVFVAHFQPASDGIMVRSLDGAVDMTAVGGEVVGAEDVVDAHKKAVEMIADAGAVAGGDIAVGQVFGDGAVDIRHGAVIEIAAHDHRRAAMISDVACHRLCLRGPFLGGCCELLDEHLRDMARRVRGQIALDHQFEVALLLGTESGALEMVVDHDDRAPLDLHAEGGAHVALGREDDALLAMDRKLAEQCHDVATMHDRVAKSIFALHHRVDILCAEGIDVGLLQTHDVGALLSDILQDGVGMLGVAKLPDIVGQHFETARWRTLWDIDREVLPHRNIADEEADNGDEHIMRLDDHPEDQEGEVDGHQNGRQQSDVAERGKRFRP